MNRWLHETDITESVTQRKARPDQKDKKKKKKKQKTKQNKIKQNKTKNAIVPNNYRLMTCLPMIWKNTNGINKRGDLLLANKLQDCLPMNRRMPQ